MRILPLDQINLPIPLPFLDLSFADQRGFEGFVRFEPDEPVHPVFRGETGNGFALVLPDAARQIGRRTRYRAYRNGRSREYRRRTLFERKNGSRPSPGHGLNGAGGSPAFPDGRLQRYSAACGIDFRSVEYFRCTGALVSNGSCKPNSLPISRIAGITSWPNKRMQVRASASLTVPSLPQIP